jgi:hypothetical protein
MAPVAPPPPSFTVTPSAGANGTIDPAIPQTVFQGGNAQFTVTPAFGYQASVGGTCGGGLNGLVYTTAPVTTHCTVVASFTPLPRYTVTPNVGAHGTIDPSRSDRGDLGAERVVQHLSGARLQRGGPRHLRRQLLGQHRTHEGPSPPTARSPSSSRRSSCSSWATATRSAASIR